MAARIRPDITRRYSGDDDHLARTDEWTIAAARGRMSERALLHPMPRTITAPQQLAANPLSSIWVEANAGSGKTRAPTDRRRGFLLEGAAPDQILCLTYTKAAAAEMQRVPPAGSVGTERLRGAGAATGGACSTASDPPQLERARTLFAHALELPGGLRSRRSTLFPRESARRTASRWKHMCRSISPWS